MSDLGSDRYRLHVDLLITSMAGLPGPQNAGTSKADHRVYRRERTRNLRLLKPKPPSPSELAHSQMQTSGVSGPELHHLIASATSSPKGPARLPVTCRVKGCKKVYSGDHREKSLQRHNCVKHEKGSQYLCTRCFRSFTRAEYRNKHYVRYHSDVSPLKAESCQGNE